MDVAISASDIKFSGRMIECLATGPKEWMMTIMPRFHFDIIDGEDLCDDTGIDLRDMQAAERHAKTMLTEALAWCGEDWEGIAISVRNEKGSVVMRLSAHTKVERFESPTVSG